MKAPSERKPKFLVGDAVLFKGSAHRIAGVYWERYLREWLYSLQEHQDFRLLEGMLTPRAATLANGGEE